MGTAHRHYFHLDLRIGRDADGYFARVEKSPYGEGAVRLELEELLPWLHRLELQARCGRNLEPAADVSPGETPRQEADRIGRSLGKAVFREGVRRCFDDSLSDARQAGKGLAIRLRADDDPLLLRLPWEVMFDPGGRSPLATSTETPLLRYVPVEGARSISPATSRLRILLVEAQPRGYRRLDAEQELERVRVSMGGRGLVPTARVDILRKATSAALRQELERGRYHVVHFIGHGLPPEDGREGFLLFETEHGDPALVDGQQLASALGLGPSREPWNELRLVVLNACHGAETEPSDGFAGVAQRLLGQGLSAVVAMRYAIADRAAIQFGEVFYRRLAQGEAVEKAVSRARSALHADQQDSSWLKPVLFSRAADGRIVRRSRSRRVALAAAAASLVGAGLLATWLGRDSRPETQSRPALPQEFFADHPGCSSAHGLALGFVYIEPKEFLMGSEKEKEERPPHTVTLTRPFCLAKTEVTEAQWETVMADSGRSLEELRRNPRGDLPWVGVTWKEAQVFVGRLNERAGAEIFFLPSEAQWEYAARAGSQTSFGFGDDVSALGEFGNCGGWASRDRFEGPVLVASFRSNDLGLYDMHGNVSEWVADWYGPYPFEPVTDPRGRSRGLERVRRGGSYYTNASRCRSAARAQSTPDSPHPSFGFRIARWRVSSSAPRPTP